MLFLLKETIYWQQQKERRRDENLAGGELKLSKDERVMIENGIGLKRKKERERERVRGERE